MTLAASSLRFLFLLPLCWASRCYFPMRIPLKRIE